MVYMQRSLKALPLALIAAALFFPAVASAKNINVGATKTKITAPICPNDTTSAGLANCRIVLYWATAIPSMGDKVAYPTTVTTPGKITSFTLGVSRISSNATLRKQAVQEVSTEFGGPPKVRLAVLRAVGSPGALSWRVMSQSGVWTLSNDLGRVVTLHLGTALPVVKGDVLALTVPTWAPILLYWAKGDPINFEYRVSYSNNCGSQLPTNVNVQSTIGEFAKYGCQFNTRPEFTANEATS